LLKAHLIKPMFTRHLFCQ